MPHKPLVFSGVQPTGNLHLGNYLGAIRNWIPLQSQHPCMFCVVDLHAITGDFLEPALLRNATRHMAAAYLASGIDPKRSIIFNQSQVPAHAELAWIFNCVARLGWLNRMTQFKDKAGKDREKASAGLYVYPNLMAADVLLYKATHVPVGEDQKQHLELMRDIAQKFNNDYGVPDFFPLPEPLITGPATRVMSLRDGKSKMSKSDPSEASRILLADSPEKIMEKIRKARTDPLPLPETVDELKTRPEADNLIAIFAALSGESKAAVVTRFQGALFSRFKEDLGALLVEVLRPIQDEMARLERDPGHIDSLLSEGAMRARAVAAPILAEVFDIVGFCEGLTRVMQIDQAIRRFGARMSAGLAALIGARTGGAPWTLRIDRAMIIRGLMILPVLVVLYYLIGAAWSHRIDPNLKFDIPEDARLDGDSYAVGLAIGLLDREVNQNGWVANSPFYLPTALLHNMASFQTGIVETVRSLADVLDAVLKSRGTSSVDLEVTADKLSKRPDIWSWDWSEPWGYLGNSEREYREALLDLQGYNVALSDGTSILPKDAAALAMILKRLSAGLRAAAVQLEQEAVVRPLVLSRRVGDAVYRGRGVAYCQFILLRGLKSDFGPLLQQRNLLGDWQRAEEALKRVALFSPLFVINGSPDNVLLPSHPLNEGYYLLDGERALLDLIAKLS